MKRIVRKIHHFTKRELVAEEVIVFLIISLLAGFALAASAVLPVRAGVVQCGAKEELSQSCREDERCCALLEMSGFSSEAEDVMPSPSPYSSQPHSAPTDKSYIDIQEGVHYDIR